MKNSILFLSVFLITMQIGNAQFPTLDPNWTYFRSDNTGVGGDYHETVRGDRFGNIWTGGYLPFWSQGSLVRFDGTTFTNWGTYSDNYLPDDRISNIAFDHNDRIWVGTQNGLGTSPDGLSWQHYTSSNTPLEYDLIRGIAIEDDNDVWVVTGEWGQILTGGVGYFNGTSWNFYTSSNSNLPTQQVSDIAIDRNNNKWITCNLGLIKYDGLNWILYTSSNSGLSPGAPREVMVDSLNRVWVCNGQNIDIFDGTSWSHLNNTIWPVANFDATSMYIRGNKMIFSETTNSSRVMMYDGVNWSWEWTNYFLMSSYIDINGNFWISGSGVVRKYESGQWKNYTRHSTALAENFNEDIFVDSKNRKWFANGNGGIQIMDCPNWEVYGILNEGLFPNPQSQSYVGSAITETPDGDIWFTYDATDGYAVQIPNGEYQNYASWVIWDKNNAHPWFQEPEEIEGNDSGKVFFRTFWANTFMYNKRTNSWTLWDLSNGLTGQPSCMKARSGDRMYLGHYGGIDVYDSGTWTAIDLMAVGISYVYDIEFDTEDNMWIGSWEGLWKFDGTAWTNWNISNSNIAANPVWAVEIDKVNNIIYAGAHNTQTWPYYGGISYFNGTGNVFSTFLEGSSPISHKQVEDLALDTLGNIWILTQSEGVTVHNPNGVLGFECIDKRLETGPTGIASNTSIVNDYFVSQNYPNPFNPVTNLEFGISERGFVSLKVYNLIGKEMATLVNENLNPGTYKYRFDGSKLTSGVYFYTLKVNGFSETKRMILIK